jgi:Zn-dependent protease with chaperone function
MSFTETLCLALAAVYAFTCILLSIGVALSWHAGLERRRWGSGELLTWRLLPAVGAAFLTLAVALPAFLIHEPHHASEPVGPLLIVLALFALVGAGHGMLRGWRAWGATRALLRRCGPATLLLLHTRMGRTVDIVNVPEPLAAVVGAWRPRILVADCFRAACSDEEFRQVIAHEAAHLAAHDNVKLLLQNVSPDALTWMAAGTALTARWRAAAELEADALASGSDPRKRVALASALLKVARLSSGIERCLLALSMPVAVDDVEGRVRELLAPAPVPYRRLPWRALVACALIITVVGILLSGNVHEFMESLVAFGTSYDGW